MSNRSVIHSAVPARLSSEQLATLQTLLVFLEGVTTRLDTENRSTNDVDVELTKTVRDLGLYCKDRMLTAFPDLAVWRAIGNGDVKS